MAMAHEAQALGMARVYWHGAHTAQIVNSPLGKLHSEGLALLRAHSWECVPASDPRVPGFAFTTRKGADFPATGPGLPRVRQFPQRCTAVLDDKARLAQCLEAAGCASIAPRTWTDLDAFLAQHSSSGSVSRSAVGGGSGSSMAAQPAASGSQLYFLKHRHGVKGQAVYPFTSLPSLLDRLRSLGGGQQGTSQPSCSQQGSGQEGSMQQGSGQEGSMQQSSSGGQPGGSSSQEGSGGPRSSGASSERRRNQQAASHSGGSRQHFVVQEGVEAPLLLPDGRKFTLRAHVLMLLEHSDCHAAGSMAQQAQPGHHGQEQQLGAQEQLQRQPQKERPKQQAPRLRAWVHEDVIVTPHAAPLAAGGPAAGAAGAAGIADVAVHVSSRGRGHPKPFLLNQLGLELQQERQQPESQPALPGEPSEQRPPSIGATQLQQELWRQICSISRAAVAAGAQHRLVPSRADPQAVLYHLWAFDFAVAAGEPPADVAATLAASQQVAGEACKAGYAAEGEGQQAQAPHLPPRQPRVLLLEANSYPAIASGTMAAVPRALYTRLIGDLLTLVVLPALGNGGERAGEGAAGGFVRVL